VATSPSPLSYQWQKNGIYLAGATASTLTVANVQSADAGRYSVLVQNRSGIAVSAGAVLEVTPPTSIITQPISQRVAADGNATLRVVAPVPLAPSNPREPVNPATIVHYQWLRDGVVLDGAAGATLITNQPGSYRVLVGNTAGSIASTEAVVTAPAVASRLSNLSVRSRAGAGGQTLTVGFVTSGANGEAGTPLLIRAVGPGLASFGIFDFLIDPRLQLYQGTALVTANDNWGENSAQVAEISARVGAFALSNSASLDAALYNPALRPNGLHRASCAGECRDGNGFGGTLRRDTRRGSIWIIGASDQRFSADTRYAQQPVDRRVFHFRSRTETRTRESGGSVALAIRVDGVLSRPQLTLYSGAATVAANADWRGDSDQVAAGALRVGGFALDYRGADAALIITLAPVHTPPSSLGLAIRAALR